MCINLIVNLPDDVMHKVLCYVEAPVKIASVLGLSILPLCHSAKEYVDNNEELWEKLLGGYYLNTDTSSSSSSSSSAANNAYRARTQRRSSKRLRRRSSKEAVIHAHFVLRDQTEMALQEVADLAISKTPNPLSLGRLRGIFNNYGPILNINQRSAIGGTFLVDCLRSRYVTERVILTCVKELIEKYGASPNVSATEGAQYNSVRKKQKKDQNLLPPLVVAAARGMSSIVEYLIQDNIGTLTEIEGTSRFRLFTNPKKSISGTYTPLDYAKKMKEAEIMNGAGEHDLKSLNRCIQLLS